MGLVSLNDVVRRLEQGLARATDRSIAVEHRLYPQLDPIRADPAAIDRMVLAVARSSVDAMPKGGTLTFETDTVYLDPEFVANRPGMQAGAHAMLLVRDTRPVRRDSKGGFAKGGSTKGSFARERSADMQEAKAIAVAAGGRIESEMVLGAGRSCRVYFPAADPNVIAVVTEQSNPDGETVLLVDDTESLRDTLERVLSNFGFSVLVARDGAQALEVSETHPGRIDLLLTDVVMPGIGGLELAVRLRMERPLMRVLLMSGYDEHSLASGAGNYASFIAKPFRPMALGQRIREMLDQPIPAA